MLGFAAAASAYAAPPIMPISNAIASTPIRLGVNGFGRTSRQARVTMERVTMEREPFVLKPEAVNTVHGRFSATGTCELLDDGLLNNERPLSLSVTRGPSEIPKKTVSIEGVRESSGVGWSVASSHKVIISEAVDTPTMIVVGVNTDDYEPDTMPVVTCCVEAMGDGSTSSARKV